MSKTKIYGPYYKEDNDEKWHWIRSCPHYPDYSKSKAMITSTQPPEEILCEECLKSEITFQKKRAG